MVLSNESLMDYYKLSFSLKQHQNYSFEEFDNIFPFEKEIYVAMILDQIQKENDRIKNG
jgi:hypothetical protein